MSKKSDELLDSNYDGIKEFDNDLPKWWIILFYLTIIFGLVYFVYFTFGPGLSSDQRLSAELEAIKQLQKSLPVEAKSSAEDLLKLVKQPERLEKGRLVYEGKCAACHAPLGQGLVGPNLTDNYWLHGGKITDIKNVIEVGVLEKGMLAWKGLLTPEEIDEVTAFVFSLKGSNPPDAKAPQGVVDEG